MLFARKQEFKRNESLEELYYLSKISSSHKEPKGILKVINYTSKELSQLGFTCQMIEGDGDAICPSLEANYNVGADFTIGLVCHADTVQAVKSKKQIYIERDYIFGPGVADNKGGIVCLLESLRYLLNKKQSLPFNIKVIVSSEEEIGSPNFQKYFSLVKNQLDMVFGFEPAMSDGSLIVERDGNYWLEVKAEGIEAHCGRARGEELNAFHDFSRKYYHLLHEIEKQDSIRLHLGSVSTKNHAFNVVCGDLNAKMDIRFSDLKKLNEFLPKLHSIFKKKGLTNAKNEKVKYSFEVYDFCPPMVNSISHEFLRPYQLAVQYFERSALSFAKSGGASDLCYLSTDQNICIDGFGPISHNMHRMDENLYIPSLESRAKSFAEFLLAMSQNMEVENGSFISC